MHIVRRFSRVAAGAALALALLLLFGVALVQALGWYRFVPVLSASMSPYIDTGDVAVLEPVDATDLAVGDVIAFEAPIGDRQLMLHRVSEIVERSPNLRIRTQGDANATEDPWTASIDDAVVWTATGEIPALGRPVVAAHRIGTTTILMMGVVSLLALLLLRGLWQPRPPDDTGIPAAAPQPGRPTESIVTLSIVAAVIVVGVGLLVTRPVRAAFTASAAEEQRVTYASTPPRDPLPPPTDLVASIVCDVAGTPTGVRLRWSSPATPADRITVERSSTPLAGESEPFVVIGAVGPVDQTFTDDFASVDPPPTNPLDLRYRVRSESTTGATSAYSNVATTGLCEGVLAPTDRP